MALNFPSNPSTNDTYSYGGKTWVYTGSAWKQTGANAANITTTGNVTAGNILSDNYFYANGDPFTSYTDTDVETLLSGNITIGNISVTGIIDGYATTTYVDNEVANLVNSAPSSLDTLSELADALGNDANLSVTLTNLIGNNTSNVATLQSQVANLNYYDDVNVATYLTTYDGNLTAGNILTDNYFYANGEPFVSSNYGDTDVADYLIQYTGNISSGNIDVVGNITASYFLGNGSQLTGIQSGANVTVSETPPNSPSDGDVWIDSIIGVQLIYVNDGDSSQWIDFQSVINNYGGGNYGDSDVLDYLSAVSGNIIPSSNVTYNLGSPTNQWHSLYVGPGSVYVNGKKVIEDNSGRITVSTSVNQNLAIKTSGTGDIELFPDGSGVINLQGNVQVDSGVSLSGIGGLKFGSNLNLDNNNINNLDDPVQSQDAATKAYVDDQIASAQGNYGDSNVLSYLGNISGNLIPSANVTYNLGSETQRWNTLYLAGNTIDLGGAQIKADPDAGTIALIPQIKPGETATKAIVIGSSGISTVDTDTDGNVSAANIAAASTSANTTTGNIDATGVTVTNSLTVNSSASISGNITVGNILTDNYLYANGVAFVSGISYDQSATSTGYLALPVGNTAQRPITPSVGMIRYNSTSDGFEFYTASSEWLQVLSLGLASVSPSTFDGSSGTSFTLSGSGFAEGTQVRFITSGGNVYLAGTVTINSLSQITATTPRAFTVADEPLSVRVTSSTGISATLSNVIDCGGSPTWANTSGTIATVYEDEAMSSVVLYAEDPDNNNVSYEITSGALPTGITMANTTVGNINAVSISGTANASGGWSANGVTYNFEITATDTGNNQVPRTFSIIKKWYDGSTSALAATGGAALYDYGIRDDGIYWINIKGTPTQIYCDMTNGGWMLYSSFGNDNTYTAASYPAISGNRILIGQLSTNGYTGYYTNYADGATSDFGGGYSRRLEYLSLYYSSTPVGYLDLTTWNGNNDITSIKTQWGDGASNFTSSDLRLIVNNITVQSGFSGVELRTASFDPTGATPLIRWSEGGIVGVSTLWCK